MNYPFFGWIQYILSATRTFNPSIIISFCWKFAKTFKRFQKVLSHVDYNLGKADIDCVQSVNEVALKQAVKDAGYIPVEYKEEKKMKKVVTVDGMMCMHCVAHVKDALSKVEGVSDVVVSLDEKTATLNCTENVTDQMLSDAVTNAGYTVISVK